MPGAIAAVSQRFPLSSTIAPMRWSDRRRRRTLPVRRLVLNAAGVCPTCRPHPTCKPWCSTLELPRDHRSMQKIEE